MTSPPPQKLVCPACGTSGAGRFCAECGATLSAVACSACQAPLAPGARFCHRCGKPTAAAASRATHAAAPQARILSASSSLPWAVAGIALVALLAVVAGKFFSERASGSEASQNPPQAGLGEPGGVQPGQIGGGSMSGSRAPDISRMSPEERAERLFDRVMLLASQGKNDSVLFFAPMALDAYQLLSPTTIDHRYDVGRIAEVAGALPLAKAQADTILLENPNHLLGLILAARIASLSGNENARRQYETRLLAAEKTETSKRMPEYERHRDDIEAGLATARRSAVKKG